MKALDYTSIADKVKTRRSQLGYSLAELAELSGVNKSTLQRYESGAIKNIPLSRLQALSAALDMEPDELIGTKKCRSPSLPEIIPLELAHLKRIPILGRIAAGTPIYAAENIEGYTYTDLNGGHEYFGLRVRGDSMDAARIHDGDVAIVRRQDVVDNGQIAVCLIDGEEATLKRFMRNENIVTLMPQSTNPVHQALVFDIRQTHVDILGLVVRVEFAPV